MQRPAGVTAIAVVFLLASAYLGVLGLVRLISPDIISLSLGASLLHGLELAGPYMFLLTATAVAVVGFGLLRLNNFARRAAVMIGLAGMVMLIPKVGADAADFSAKFFLVGVAIAVRMMIVWYLWQSWTAEKFH
jgi:hypothetical protein